MSRPFFRIAAAAAAAASPIVLSSCAPAGLELKQRGDAVARIGDSVNLGAIEVRPLALIEDSRCPSDVQCVQAGRLVLRARIDRTDGMAGGETRDLVLGEQVSAAGIPLTLSLARPYPVAEAEVAEEDYIFGFTVGETPAS